MTESEPVEVRAVVRPAGQRTRVVTHTLTAARGSCLSGSRYITRANMRDIFLGKATHAVVRNNGTQRWSRDSRQSIRAELTPKRLRIGCHAWYGVNLWLLREWALS